MGSVLQRGADEAGHGAQFLEQHLRVVGIELHTGEFRDAVEELPRGGRQLDGPLVFADAGHGPGEAGDGVVGADLRAVACPAVGHKPQPRDALLRRLEKVGALPADGGGESAYLRYRLRGPFEQLRAVLDGELGAVDAPGLLIGKESKDDVLLGLRPVRAKSRRTDRIMASMSFMSTAPRPQISPSFSSAPNGSTDHCSRSAGTTSRCPCTTSALAEGPPRQPRDHAGPARLRFEDLSFQADLGDQAGRIFGGGPFARPGTVPEVGRVDADELLADSDDFILWPDVRHWSLLISWGMRIQAAVAGCGHRNA